MRIWLQDVRSRSLPYRCAVLGLPVIVLYALVAPVAEHSHGVMGLMACLCAAVVCLAGALLALLAQYNFRRSGDALLSLLVGMAARMGLPLAVGLALYVHGGPLAQAGLLYYFLVFYPVTLLVETALTLPPPQVSSPESRAPRNAAL